MRKKKSKPVESKPVESKPVESKPVESKPVESKPVESKPVESKPVESKPVESKPVESKPVEIKIEHFLQLMNIYLSEWDHRATALWNQVFKYFCATLIVIFLPYLKSPIDINLPKSAYENFYPWATLLLSGIFLCISFGCAIRAKAAGNRYKNLVKVLPEELRQDSEPDPDQKLVNLLPKFLRPSSASVHNRKLGKILYNYMSFLICILMFVVLLLLSIIMRPLP